MQDATNVKSLLIYSIAGTELSKHTLVKQNDH